MSDAPQGPGWWQASDGKWYAPELHPDHQPTAPTPPASPPPAAPPPAASPPPAEPPATAPTAAAGPPAGAPPVGGPPPGAAAPATPPGPTPEPTSSGSRTALIVLIVVLVIALVAGVAALALSGSDDGDTAADSTTTTLDDGPTTTEDRDPPVSRTLLPRSTTTLDDGPTTTLGTDTPDLGGLEDDLDPATVLCVGEAVVANPALEDLAVSGTFDPSDPLLGELFTVLIDCGARDYLEEAFVSELLPDQATCVSEVFATMDDQAFVDVVIGLANEDLSAAAPLLDCMI